MDPERVEAIDKMEAPKDKKELQSFLGMMNYYRGFIKEYATKAEPLNRLMKKKETFVWEKNKRKHLKQLRKR